MSKNRQAVTCNGRAAFYACMWDDIRQCAMDCGWAVALHGSLNSDMDIMAMPWVEDSVPFEDLIDRISMLFKDNVLAEQRIISYEKPHNRIVASILIFSDFYLDICTMKEFVPSPITTHLDRLKKEFKDMNTHEFIEYFKNLPSADPSNSLCNEVYGDYQKCKNDCTSCTTDDCYNCIKDFLESKVEDNV